VKETGQQGNRNLGKCPKCGKATPLRSGACLYCGAWLDGVQPQREISNEKLVEEPRQLGAGSSARHKAVSDFRGHYLFLGAREPILVEPNKIFLIGRDPHASLVVNSPEVSRQHCEIDWRGEPSRPVLVEVRARNGTYVNDRPLRRGEPESIRDRDVIRLGRDFEILYRQLDERELKETLNDVGRADTRTIRVPPQAPSSGAHALPTHPMQPAHAQAPPAVTAAYERPASPGAGVFLDSGDFSQIPGGLLLETLHREKRTGKLTVFDGQMAGEVVLVDGRAKVAVLGPLQSREALEAIARTTRGVFRFAPEAPVHGSGSYPLPGATQALGAPPLSTQALGASPLASMAMGLTGSGAWAMPGVGVPAAPAAPPSIPPELMALYQAAAAAPPASAPWAATSQAPAPESRAVPPELAGIIAAAASAAAAAQQHSYAPNAYTPPMPEPPRTTQPLQQPTHVSPIRGASEPTAAQIASVLGDPHAAPRIGET
jgi:pSer/pThr/pTyr-binding forkhead associated (FHA) protein